MIQVRGKSADAVIYIDPAYLKKYYSSYPTNVLFSTWPDPIDGLPDPSLPKADCILITHHHKDHCKAVTVKRLLKKNGKIFAPNSCVKELGKKSIVVEPYETHAAGTISIHTVNAYNSTEGSSTVKQHK